MVEEVHREGAAVSAFSATEEAEEGVEETAEGASEEVLPLHAGPVAECPVDTGEGSNRGFVQHRKRQVSAKAFGAGLKQAVREGLERS